MTQWEVFAGGKRCCTWLTPANAAFPAFRRGSNDKTAVVFDVCFVLKARSHLLPSSNPTARSPGRKRIGGGGGGSLPATYLVTSLVAFASILRLRPCDPSVDECTPEEGFGTFHPHFRRWLQCLHVVLVVPTFLSFFIPDRLFPKVPSALLFGTLAIVCGAWHVRQTSAGASYVVPTTDCQISITTDLACCSLVTLYTVYKDSARARARVSSASAGEDAGARLAALTRLSVAAIAMPLISPAAVLAAHLFLCRLGESHATFVAYAQRRVANGRREADRIQASSEKQAPRAPSVKNGPASAANGGDATSGAGEVGEKLRETKWCNLGLWTSDGCGYGEACENLADALGEAAGLGPSDAVLSCGCGSLDEVRHYKDRFKLRHVTGIDPHLPEGRTVDERDRNVRAVRAGVDDLIPGEGERPLFPPRLFDKILALDNAYHYPSKGAFFRDCLALLPPGGKVAASDVVSKRSAPAPFWVGLALRAMGVPARNLWSASEYRDRLRSMGYDADVSVELVGDRVFRGWSFLPARLLEHLDYALIVATKPRAAKGPPAKRKRVAIVGSGLAGLSAAHCLLTSEQAADVDVDVYEANDRPGLAGHTKSIGEQLVDVPARMACLGYYDKYVQLLQELDIPTTVVRTDSSFYGEDGRGGRVCYGYGRSSLANVRDAIFVGGLGNLWRLGRALGALRREEDWPRNGETFGEWLQRNLGVSAEGSTTTDACNGKGVETPTRRDLPSLTCRDNPFAYVMCGSLSWMLSCTWSDLWNYPADIVLPYCRGLKMDRLGVGRDGQVVRVVPSIKVLERALLYGVRELHLNTRVAAIDGTRVVNGTAYDAVIVATEAKAVPKVVSNCSDVFAKIDYHPSTIYIHTDPSFMPPNKKDWKCWNVEMSSGRKEPQLTFHLNEFYPDARFEGNVFQTWAPAHAPKKETILARSDFERVVHSKDTRSYIDEIKRVQAKDQIYYAGSYCVYGMGLLEQALISGKEASEMVLNDLFRGAGGSSNQTRTATVAKADTAPLKALVIGAGPSGLVAAKYLLQSTEPRYDVTIVEPSDQIGGSFTNKVYDNCRLVSSKYLTAFSDHRMPEDSERCPDHPSAAQYVDYLKSYAEHFGLGKCIQFGCTVVSVKDAIAADGYEVQYKNPGNEIMSQYYDAVAVCSGLHNTPYIPKAFLPSPCETNIASKFKGEIIHSSQYKDPSIFADRRVLILGCGETAMDIAHRAVAHPRSKSVALSVRRGFLSIPHSLAEGRPLDVFITNLFEHAYEHPWVHALRLRWALSTFFIRLFLFLAGSSVGFNQWAVPTGPVKRGYHIINKSHAAMGHLNVPVKSRSMWGRFWMWVYREGGLRPIASFHGTEVVDVDDDGITVKFGDGRTYEADLIIMATGYKQSFPFLDAEIRKEIREESSQAMGGRKHNGDTGKYTIEEECLPSEHFIVDKARPRLGFIGFVRPNVGAIPPISELQVMWWLQRMRGNVNALPARPGAPPSYMVLGRKYPYGVDYGNYMHRVAEDIDAAPTLSDLAKSSQPFRALYTYCVGQSMISLFRLRGPYASKDCREVVTGELWRVCMKRGLAENCGLLFILWLSLLMNATACVLECIWGILTLTRPKFFVRY